MAAAAEAVFEDLVPPPGEVGADTKFGESPNSDEMELAEKKAIDCFVALERSELKLGLEFGRAMIELRHKKKAAYERDWVAYLKRIGISYDSANKWINKVEGNETRHGKKKASAPSSDVPIEKPVTSWGRISDEFKVIVDNALILQNSQPIDETHKARLASLARAMLKLTAGGDNA